MFKYVKFNKVETEYTVLQFNGNPVDDDIQVFQFDVPVVSVKCEDTAKIDALIASQDTRIDCKIIDKTEFKELVSNSAQINRCRTICKEHIAKKYDFADELAMINKDSSDAKVIKYKAHKAECLAICNGLKAEVGY
jgi:hypothetical protein